jgi:hypothetical protein
LLLSCQGVVTCQCLAVVGPWTHSSLQGCKSWSTNSHMLFTSTRPLCTTSHPQRTPSKAQQCQPPPPPHRGPPSTPVLPPPPTPPVPPPPHLYA